jgi:hypothetical protein
VYSKDNVPGETAINRPQGIPSNSCPIKKTGRELAKKEMKMVAFMSMSPIMVVHLYPRRVVMGPAMKTPRKAPI